ncbi:winged helix DNA-binding protein [Sphingomonas sp. C8-2]|nr:winged helix DNA-binding protein [Sphingomonas sp. C8-2]
MGGLVRETFRAMVERVEHQFNDTDLVLSQWLTLRLIGSGRIACIGDVVREIGLESGSATRLVDQLENKKLLVRKRSTTDRRVVGIRLTEEGEAVVKSTQPRLVSF